MATLYDEVYRRMHPILDDIVNIVCSHIEECEEDEESLALDNAIRALDRLKEENPNQIVSIETPEGCLSFKIGDALIYECGYGKLVMDSE